MLQTLFHIPHAIAGWPVFGLGWALAGWIVVCLVWAALLSRLPEKKKELSGSLPLMLLVAAMIAFVAPRIEEIGPDGTPLGVPIRGYGMMMLVAIVTGVGMAASRAKRMGLDSEIIFSLALWMCIAGVVGARAFYVIQKWDEQFASDDLGATIMKVLSFTEGGLVVFGSAIGALAALVAFCAVRKLPPLAIADVVAPSMMVGLAIGRVGCLLNGCCYGGYCELPLALRFPPEAPVYVDQLTSGHLFGARLIAKKDADSERTEIVVAEVVPGSQAEQVGLRVGDVVQQVGAFPVHSMEDVRRVFSELARQIEANQAAGQPTRVRINQLPEIEFTALPPRSLPVHPTQIYSAIDAALLAAVLWFYYPFRRRDGEVVALMLTLHPISRFLLEVVRVDEGGFAGTPFTVSQWVGFLFLACAIALWLYLERRPLGSALPRRASAA